MKNNLKQGDVVLSTRELPNYGLHLIPIGADGFIRKVCDNGEYIVEFITYSFIPAIRVSLDDIEFYMTNKEFWSHNNEQSSKNN